jgi:hypothetical protein
VPSYKYFGVANIDLLWVSNEDASCLRIICTILNLLEQGFNRLLGIPCSAHVFKVDFVNTSGKAGAQITHLPLGDDSPPWGR